jgi:hypothetical protein
LVDKIPIFKIKRTKTACKTLQAQAQRRLSLTFEQQGRDMERHAVSASMFTRNHADHHL